MFIVKEFSQTIRHSMSIVSCISFQYKKESVGRIIYLFTRKKRKEKMSIGMAEHCITNGSKKERERENEKNEEQSFSISLSFHLTSMCCSSLYSSHKAIVI